MKQINPAFYNKVLFSPVGSDVYSVRRRIEQKELDGFVPGHWGDYIVPRGRLSPNKQAIFVLCHAMSKLYGWDISSPRNFSIFPIDSALKSTIQRYAFETWNKRRRFEIPGDEKTDWEHGLHMVAEYFIELYEEDEKQGKVA